MSGRIVTFSGLDGAGKSSQTALLREALARRGIRAEVVWVPVAINPSLEHLKSAGEWMLRRVTSRNGAGPSHEQAEQQVGPGKRLVRRSRLARHVWATTVTLANVWSHWRAFVGARRAADVVIFDRYALDTAVRLHTWYGELGSVGFQAWLIRRLSPQPLRSYLLDVPAERALSRKVDKWELPVLERQASLYRRECGRFRVRRLDGERPVDDLAGEVCEDVLASMGRR